MNRPFVERALAQIEATQALENTGRERVRPHAGDRAELDVIERRENLRRLDALLGREALLGRLPDPLPSPLEQDLGLLDFEARPLSRDFRGELGRFLRSSTSERMLVAAYERRWARAREVAARHDDDPARAYDASNNDLLAYLLVERAEARANILLDVLAQLRALRRSPELVDKRGDGGRDDNSQGRLTTSGVLAALEQALLCQAAPKVGAERALLRLCVVNAPHLEPSAIFRASNLTIELLGAHDGGLLGPRFLPVYHAIHTLYSADSPAVVRRFVVEQLAGGLPEEHAAEILESCLDALAGERRRLDAVARRLGLDVGSDVRAFLLSRCSLPRLARAPLERQLATYRALLALLSSVCVAAPSGETLSRDACLARSARPPVERLGDAIARGDIEAALSLAVPARAALERAFARERAGARRARLWRLDRDVEHVVALVLAGVVREGDRGLARRALPAAVDGVVQSGLHFLGAEPGAFVASAAVELCASLRRRFGARAEAVHFAGVRALLDPRFVDRLVKETALHPLVELVALARRRARRSARGTAVRVIVPPAVPSFARVVDARHRSRAVTTTSDDLVVLARVDPRLAIPRAGALLVDEKAAPPGYSHLSVLARERGMGLFAVDDVAAAAARLRPLAPLALEASALVPASTSRRARRKRAPAAFTLFAPHLDDDGVAPLVTSLRALGRLPLAARRALAGEKAAVLAELLARDVGARALDGAVLTFPLVAAAMRAVGLYDAWIEGAEPVRMKREVKRRLTSLWLTRAGTPSDEGRALVAALRVTVGERHIARSSGSAEDRPHKSDAGLYHSVAGLFGARALLGGIADVIAATWSAAAVAHNASLGVPMSAIWPAVVVQRDLGPKARASGVALSRGRDGALGAISYQAVEGRGGGVRRGRAEEGFVSPVEHAVVRAAPSSPLVDEKLARRLGRAVLAIERLFHDVIEPGRGYAVDVEWVRTARELYVVQARALASPLA